MLRLIRRGDIVENLAVIGSGPKDIFENTDFICYFTDYYLYIVETCDTDSYINKVLESDRNLPYELKKLPVPKERIIYSKMVMIDGVRVNKDNVSNLEYQLSINKLTFTYKKRVYEITIDYDNLKELALFLKKIFKYDTEIGK